ncbi:MAG: hypothetical protein AUG75_15015 [Cyanobacteria bacterium 13_1_20CM_4_61_6]|nr:MAG: hypothetical protein AUG75_15015 [Cyanobacteria bacterium 13_1_20CM_4_61_6]
MQKRWTAAVAVVSALALLVGACGGGTSGGGASTAKTVKIISSLPMTGASRTQTVEIVNSIQMAIADTKINNVTVQFEALDDATAAKGSWDAAQEAENARKAINDKSVVAYIGTYNSGAAKVSIPLLNQAGLVMVSPANTYPGLTKPGKGEANEPNTYFPNGKRNYARVVPADDLQGAVGAVWAKDLGAKKVYIVHDTQLYGKGIADVFRAKAKDLGLTEAGYEGADKADNYRALAKNVYSTFGGVPPEKYTGKAADWLKAYNAKYNNNNPNPYAIYGYEAAKVVLAAIAAAGDKADDRATVLANVMGTKNYDGVLGKWSFDANGDTTLTQFSGSVAKSGSWSFVKELAVSQ